MKITGKILNKIQFFSVIVLFLLLTVGTPFKAKAYLAADGVTDIPAGTISGYIEAHLAAGDMSAAEIGAVAKSFFGDSAAEIIKDVYREAPTSAAINSAVDTALGDVRTAEVNGQSAYVAANGTNQTVYTPGGVRIGTFDNNGNNAGQFTATNGDTVNISSVIGLTVSRTSYATDASGGSNNIKTLARSSITTMDGSAWVDLRDQNDVGATYNTCMLNTSGSGCLAAITPELTRLGIAVTADVNGNLYYGTTVLNNTLTGVIVYSMCPPGTVANPAYNPTPGVGGSTTVYVNPGSQAGGTGGTGAQTTPASGSRARTGVTPGGTMTYGDGLCADQDAVNLGDFGTCDFGWPVTITSFTALPITATKNVREVSFTWAATDHFSSHMLCRIEGNGLMSRDGLSLGTITGDKEGGENRKLSVTGVIPFTLTCSNSVHGTVRSASKTINVRVVLPGEKGLEEI